ncbi:flagellar hook-basal body complex protein FliE [Pleionea sp. CnH1-48]|uniref:flagellar hook-basal body complex protein FliE n=1 Tax=Pleionea sp. CnH1-48 TaxID=2954494 RepID=UPI002096B242|nr:flagellar hook-basal body complex protein FliE [Pleionea sp. CnH1-48]MCO7226127.1 flagellar hook-basal body complex protein FliE [Pleionea sp. CnH1-48]
MNQITPEQILAHMRRLSDVAQQSPAQPTGKVESGGDFTQALSKAINQVNELQKESSQAARQIEAGDGGVSLVKAMIASQKSGVAFDAVVQVRNRVVSAYQDIMNMPI